jgi:hypothetical protein
MQPPSRTGASCPLRHGLDPNTYRAIRRGRDRPPFTEASVGLLRPVDARVGRRIDIAIGHHGGKFLCIMGNHVDQGASDRASYNNASPDMHTRCNHHRGQGHLPPCVMALIQSRTVPSDEDAICHQLREPASVCSVQGDGGVGVGGVVGVVEGAWVGVRVGPGVGDAVGVGVGGVVGVVEGAWVGVRVGPGVGDAVGVGVGGVVGVVEGAWVGVRVGPGVGDAVGVGVGGAVGGAAVVGMGVGGSVVGKSASYTL